MRFNFKMSFMTSKRDVVTFPTSPFKADDAEISNDDWKAQVLAMCRPEYGADIDLTSGLQTGLGEFSRWPEEANFSSGLCLAGVRASHLSPNLSRSSHFVTIDSRAEVTYLSLRAAQDIFRNASQFRVVGHTYIVTTADMEGRLPVDIQHPSSGTIYRINFGRGHGIKDCPLDLLWVGHMIDIGAVLHFERYHHVNHDSSERIELICSDGIFQFPHEISFNIKSRDVLRYAEQRHDAIAYFDDPAAIRIYSFASTKYSATDTCGAQSYSSKLSTGSFGFRPPAPSFGGAGRPPDPCLEGAAPRISDVGPLFCPYHIDGEHSNLSAMVGGGNGCYIDPQFPHQPGLFPFGG